jgi:hypothetical protein
MSYVITSQAAHWFAGCCPAMDHTETSSVLASIVASAYRKVFIELLNGNDHVLSARN